MIKIVKKFIDELNSLIKDKNVHVKPSTEAVEYLVSKGFSSKMGARPLQRTIDEFIKKPMSREILFGKLTNGGVVEVTVEDDKLKLNIVDVLPVKAKITDENTDTETELQ
jgi:ATP-dependent Clp protease ATP-binding subunit ClpA